MEDICVKSQIRAETQAAFVVEKSALKDIQTRERCGGNVIGSWGEPTRKREAIQGQLCVVAHAYPVGMHSL